MPWKAVGHRVIASNLKSKYNMNDHEHFTQKPLQQQPCELCLVSSTQCKRSRACGGKWKYLK